MSHWFGGTDISVCAFLSAQTGMSVPPIVSQGAKDIPSESYMMNAKKEGFAALHDAKEDSVSVSNLTTTNL